RETRPAFRAHRSWPAPPARRPDACWTGCRRFFRWLPARLRALRASPGRWRCNQSISSAGQDTIGGNTGEFFMGGGESELAHLGGGQPNTGFGGRSSTTLHFEIFGTRGDRPSESHTERFQCNAITRDGMFYRAKGFCIADFKAEIFCDASERCGG